MPKPFGKKMEMVRCLGPGKEHTFRRSIWLVSRICPRCREEMRKMSAMAIDPIRTNGEVSYR